jgi:sphingomyelin phosphodiesterase
MSYNVMFLNGHNFQDPWRAMNIPKQDWIFGHDILVVNELFDDQPADLFTETLWYEGAIRSNGYPYWTPVVGHSRDGWDATEGSYSSAALEDGGVAIYSRWPIERKVQYIYADGCGYDWYANKGFAYVRINVNGKRYHVVGTHTQSDGCGSAEVDRRLQFRELNRFLTSLNIPSSEQVYIAGDLNVDRGNAAEYQNMLGILQAYAPTAFDGQYAEEYSFDPTRNTVAAWRYPGYPRQNLDYILSWHGNTLRERPNDRLLTVCAPSSPEYRVRVMPLYDWSDHYPVVNRPVPFCKGTR